MSFVFGFEMCDLQFCLFFHIQKILSVFFPNFHATYPLLYYNNQINERALIGQLAVGYCAGKLTEKSRVF